MHSPDQLLGQPTDNGSFQHNLTPISSAELSAQADLDAARILETSQELGGTATFASLNGIFQSDEFRPGVELPTRVYMSKTTLTESAPDDC